MGADMPWTEVGLVTKNVDVVHDENAGTDRIEEPFATFLDNELSLGFIFWSTAIVIVVVAVRFVLVAYTSLQV